MAQKYQLDWRMKLLFWLMRHQPAIKESNLQQVRRGAEADPLGFLSRRFSVAHIENRSIIGRQGSIPVRIYRPAAAGSLPLIVFFHGGGWVLGGLDSHDKICRRFAAENKALVMAVAYRLAPEYKYPAAVEDAYDATCWAAEHAAELGADPEKLIVMGDSAGGNMAAVVCLMSRKLAGPRVAFQVLVYPVVDMSRMYPSKERYGDSPVLNRKTAAFFHGQYIHQPADLKDPHVSPLLADDLSHLPPALILTAEYDSLHDEGQAYAERLRAAGNEVIDACIPGMPHGFLSFGWLASGAGSAYARIKQALQRFSAEN